VSTSVGPYAATIDVAAGVLDCGVFQARHLSDCASSFKAGADLIVQGTDPRIYTTSMIVGDPDPADMTFGITCIAAGTVEGEYYMTRGHIHENAAAETYTFLAGSGGVLCRRGRLISWTEASIGSVVYIPPDWAHRTINTGSDNLVFLSAVIASAGHDYAYVEAEGMGARVVDIDGSAVVAVDDACELCAAPGAAG
jgi:glucose-6-phosphate isomerase